MRPHQHLDTISLPASLLTDSLLGEGHRGLKLVFLLEWELWSVSSVLSAFLLKVWFYNNSVHPGLTLGLVPMPSWGHVTCKSDSLVLVCLTPCRSGSTLSLSPPSLLQWLSHSDSSWRRIQVLFCNSLEAKAGTCPRGLPRVRPLGRHGVTRSALA